MKNRYSAFTFIILMCFTLTIFSQEKNESSPVKTTWKTFTGKPRYHIITKRAGIFLGAIDIELFPKIAPNHVNNFDSLVSKSFYDSTAFHRVIPGFMIQGGDPNSRHGAKSTWGMGDPSQPKVNAEFSAARHVRGILSAARDSDPNSANSQFFICVATAAWLDGKYSIYGHVTSGMNIADSIVLSPRDANDDPLKKIEMFITYTGSNDSVPNNPVLKAPANYSAVSVIQPTLSWSSVQDAIIYHLELSSDSLFSTVLVSKDVSVASTIVTGLAGCSKYYWRVRANNGGNLSAYSQVWSFTTPMSAPNLLSPAKSINNVPLDPVFKWDPLLCVNAYRLQVATNGGFTPAGLVYNQNNLPVDSQQVTGLLLNTHYYWRVCGINGSGEGSFSPVYSFYTVTSIGINNITSSPQGYKLEQNYPNPGNGQSGVTYGIPQSAQVSIKLFDIMGRELATLVNEVKDKGEYQLNIDLNKFPAGLYVYEMRSGDFVAARKLIYEK